MTSLNGHGGKIDAVASDGARVQRWRNDALERIQGKVFVMTREAALAIGGRAGGVARNEMLQVGSRDVEGASILGL